MSVFRARSILAFVFAVTFHSHSYAGQGIYGCWDNIHQVHADPKYSPQNVSTADEGEIICFKKNGVIVTTHIGGFEALGTDGRFSYAAGRLVLTKKELADGWPFAFKKDRCNASLSSDQLTITGCKDWEASRALILHKETSSPDMNGVRAGVFQ